MARSMLRTAPNGYQRRRARAEALDLDPRAANDLIGYDEAGLPE